MLLEISEIPAFWLLLTKFFEIVQDFYELGSGSKLNILPNAK